jgi:hypothetical protein
MTTQHVLKGFLLSAAIGLCLSAPPASAGGAGAGVVAMQASASAQLQARAAQFLARLTPAQQDRLRSGALAKVEITDEWSELVQNAIDPGSYQCNPDSPFKAWIEGQVAQIDPVALNAAGSMGGLSLPAADAVVFGSESKSNTFGVNGEYTHLLTSEIKDLRRFWDIHTADIQLIPMHGADVFSSVDRIARAYEFGFGLPHADAQEAAAIMYELIQTTPSLQGGKHPLFSLNAFAVPGSPGLSDRVIMGDGLLQAMAGIGLGDVAPRAILAHEFSHQVQFDDNLFVSPLTGAEATRRTELMADAFGTYFLTHARGEALNAKRLLPSEQAFYAVGDCNFDYAGHHGTPNQRLRASTWGADLANGAQKQGFILPSLVLDADFEQELPVLVAPDAQ